MKKIIFTILLIGSAHLLFAQYLHYWDNSHPRRYEQPVENPKPVEEPKPREIMPAVITKPVKINPITLVRSIALPVATITIPPRIVRPPMIFHDWPDKCPALSGSLPVFNNYVPAEIALIVTEKFKGHLYSICSYQGPHKQLQYKLKICSGGMIRYEYADHKGNIISEDKP
jgi:hypothetical protein